MNCSCKVDQRRLTPGVFNLKQFLNGSETMVWEVDNCIINDGTCDLKQYEAFLTLSAGGEIDEIMLTKRHVGDKLQLLWNVGTYATALTGYVKYQISFRSAEFDTLGVISGDPEATGVYPLLSELTEGIYREFQKPENGYSIKWDTENGCWALFAADGVTAIDYQTVPSTEPHCGAWKSIAVGNNEAAAWVSDEAVMFISESIAADQTITGNFPTILRQVWHRVHDMVVKSGVSVFAGEITADDWDGEKAPYFVNATAITQVPTGCTITDVRLCKALDGGGFSDIDNIKVEQSAAGEAVIYCLEKIAGKLAVTIKGGNDYVFVPESVLDTNVVQYTTNELEGI